jgi:hypothetical protein
MRCSVCANEDDRGTAAYMRFGTTVTRSLLLGIEGTGWQRSADAGTRRLVALSSAAWWHPSPQQVLRQRGRGREPLAGVGGG